MSLYIPRSIIPGDDLKTLLADSYSSFERPDVLSICIACGGPMKIIASIEDSFVIGKILSHLEARYCLQGQRIAGLEPVGHLQRFASHLKSHGWSMDTAQ